MAGCSREESWSRPVRLDLVVRARSGDREAFDALAADQYDRLYAVGRRILRDGHAAEDAVQEALIRAWRDLRSLREPERFEAWMHRLLVRACYDQTRRRRPFEVTIGPIDADRSDSTDDIAAVAHRDELERAFLTLSVDQRAVLVLTHYLGMPSADVARTLGIPIGTVHSRLHRAIRAMRGALTRAARQDLAVREVGR
jgi:RNA polymerase sigma-70 factor (ECF subfamily)